MLPDKNVYLIGFMGTGKTVAGKLLADRLGRSFVEMDEEIERREGKKIVDIFSQRGEDYFRKVEKLVLKEIAGKNNLVVSCGGGVVIDPENLKILKETGIVVRLDADCGVIYERTKKHTHRPLLNVADPQAKIKEILDKRERFYRQAHHSIDTSFIPVNRVVEKIVEILEK
ncbi:MAG: shikimate kinase [Candidatus Omnitrophica bacterium]|nr:shikimate kinase [Candidatus Omnitrophota bacterium]